MSLNIAIGISMMIATAAIHTAFMMIALNGLETYAKHLRSRMFDRFVLIGGSVLLMFVASLLEASLWAALYVLVGAISGWEPALYFSTVTYTTLGYGDVVLDTSWRLLASVEAANGIIMFGWTTAVVVAVVQRVYTPMLAHKSRDGGDR